MLIGYASVSTQDQNLEPQIEALVKAGCKEILEEKLAVVALSHLNLLKRRDPCEKETLWLSGGSVRPQRQASCRLER